MWVCAKKSFMISNLRKIISLHISVQVLNVTTDITGLTGKTSLDQARIEAAADILTEVREATFPAFFAKDKDKKVRKYVTNVNKTVMSD